MSASAAATLPIYFVDAFAERPFTGNPAAICPLERWLDDRAMQAIAAEIGFSETAFLVREGTAWRIRWFTPTLEVDLVGPATLAVGADRLTGRRVLIAAGAAPIPLGFPGADRLSTGVAHLTYGPVS